MVDHRTASSEQAAGRAAGRRPQGFERDILAAAHRLALGDIPERYGPPTTCYNRFVRWRKIGVWDRIFEAIAKAYDGDLQSVDSSSIKVHQHGADGKGRSKKPPKPPAWLTFEPSAWGVREAA